MVAHRNIIPIEGSWTGIKGRIQKRNRATKLINSHLLYFIWRRRNQTKLWGAFLHAIRKMRYALYSVHEYNNADTDSSDGLED